MAESAEFEGGTQEELRLDLRALFQGAIRVVIENVLQEEVRELVGARRFEGIGITRARSVAASRGRGRRE